MKSGIISRLMSAITPKSDNYFNLFNSLAESAVKDSKVLAMMTAPLQCAGDWPHALCWRGYFYPLCRFNCSYCLSLRQYFFNIKLV